MKIWYTPFTYVLLFIFFFISAAQGQVVDKVATGLQHWVSNYPQEKIFLQTDKQQLVAGADILFKAWCTYANKPTFLSKILYVDFIDEKGGVIQKKMYKIDSSGSAHGIVTVGKNMPSGNYRVNAYTLWMLNFPNFISSQNVYVYGTDFSQKSIGKKNPPQLKMTFFPEGGELINGIKNRMAFKIIDTYGMPVNVNGIIKDEKSNTIISFTTLHDGMGYFEFEPNITLKYSAEIQTANGVTLNFTLPRIKNEGVNLMVQNSKNRISIIVNRAEQNKEKYNALLLAAHINGKLVYAGNFNFNENKTATSISKKGLPPGIIQFTLFDSFAMPLAERLAFVDNYKIVKPGIVIEKKEVQKRSENKLNFIVDSLNGENLSILIKTGAIDNNVNYQDNIASSLLLTSDLKGIITNAGYYFANKADSTLKHLDVLLMVNGWRRFVWQDVIAKKELNLKYPIESNMNIRGKATKSDRNDIIKEGKVAFIIKGEDSSKIISDAYLTDKGEFIVDSLSFYKKATVFYEAQNNKREKSIVDVAIYKSYIDTLIKSSFIPTQNLDTSDISNRKNAFAQTIYSQIATIDTLTFGFSTLAGVTVTAKKLSIIDSLQRVYVSSIFENSDNTIDFSDAGAMVNIWQYLQMQIPGFEVNPYNGGGATARFTRNDGIAGLSEDVRGGGIMFMLNEIEVSSDFIDNISPEDVALVKVYKGNAAFAWGAVHGMIAVYTKKGVSRVKPYEKVFSKMEIQGFEANREFFNVDYNKQPDLNKNTIDKRQTLYWNPKIKKDKSGKYNIHFYNNDIGNSYKLIIQGIDKDGQLIHHEQIIQ